jgi:hypothetical protein
MKEEYLLFWRGPFSQWFKSPMTIDGIQFNTCEQYMMYRKAMLFKDKETAAKIMRTDDPKIQKQLGREVKHFDAIVWDRHKEEVVYTGNLNKFQQNEKLRNILFDTGDKILVEASPYDRIWGIGLSEDDPDALDKTKWLGQNLLGYAVTKVKETLRQNK